MATQLKNGYVVTGVIETTQTTGTGTLDLDGSQTGYKAFVDLLNDGDAVYYEITDDPSAPTEYEVGYGTFNTGSPNTLTRTAVIQSSTGSKISLSAGTTYTVTGVLPVEALGTAAGLSRGNLAQGAALDTAATKSAGSSEIGMLGEIKPYALATLPTGWLWVDGATIGDVGSGATHEGAQYEALFDGLKGISEYGNTGSEVFANGDTVALPDYRGKTPIGANHASLPNGADAAYSTRNLGETGGEEEHTLVNGELSAHAHAAANGTRLLETDTSNNSRDEVDTSGTGALAFDDTSQVFRSSTNTATNGGDAAHNNMQPFAVCNFIIKY